MSSVDKMSTEVRKIVTYTHFTHIYAVWKNRPYEYTYVQYGDFLDQNGTVPYGAVLVFIFYMFLIERNIGF